MVIGSVSSLNSHFYKYMDDNLGRCYFCRVCCIFSLAHAYDIMINVGGFQGNKIMFKLLFNYLINILVREKDQDKLNLSLKL